MKYSSKALLAAAVLIAATLFTSSTNALQNGRAFRSMNELTPFKGFDIETKSGTVVGMTAVKKDGSKLVLQQQSRPTAATSCPAGQHLTCWEDHDQMMSVCVCTTPSGSSGLIGFGIRIGGD